MACRGESESRHGRRPDPVGTNRAATGRLLCTTRRYAPLRAIAVRHGALRAVTGRCGPWAGRRRPVTERHGPLWAVGGPWWAVAGCRPPAGRRGPLTRHCGALGAQRGAGARYGPDRRRDTPWRRSGGVDIAPAGAVSGNRFGPDGALFWRSRIAFWTSGAPQNLKSGSAVSIRKSRLCRILMMDIRPQREPNDGQSYRPIVEMFE